MVWFYCDNCGDSIKKPKLDGHSRSCGSYSFTCIDCSVTFPFSDAKAHNTCVTEHQKYALCATKPGGFAANGFPGNAAPEQAKPSAESEPTGLQFLSTRPPWACSLCNVKTTSRETLMGHASGKAHQRKVRAATGQNQPAQAADAAAAAQEPAASKVAEAAAANGKADAAPTGVAEAAPEQQEAKKQKPNKDKAAKKKQQEKDAKAGKKDRKEVAAVEEAGASADVAGTSAAGEAEGKAAKKKDKQKRKKAEADGEQAASVGEALQGAAATQAPASKSKKKRTKAAREGTAAGDVPVRDATEAEVAGAAAVESVEEAAAALGCQEQVGGKHKKAKEKANVAGKAAEEWLQKALKVVKKKLKKQGRMDAGKLAQVVRKQGADGPSAVRELELQVLKFASKQGDAYITAAA